MTDDVSPAVQAFSAVPGPRLTIDSGELTPRDPSSSGQTLTPAQWDRLSGQRDVMIRAMVRIFTWLNGGVFGLTFVAWLVGIWVADYRIVDGKTLMTLISGTVIQAGIAFVAITRFLFPAGGKANEDA